MSKLVNNYKKTHSGFTIIEATVAIAVLIIGLFTVIQFFPLALKIIGDSQSTTIASNMALSQLEEIISQSYDSINTGIIETKQKISTDPTNYLYNFQRQTEVEYIDSSFNSSVNDIGLKKITITVFWQSPVVLEEKTFKVNFIKADF